MKIPLAVIVVAAGCRLGPLVDDRPATSVHLLPSGTPVPSASTDPDLANQIMRNSGLDVAALKAAGNLIPRGTGASGSASVRYWAFGRATIAPSPAYELYRDVGGTRTPTGHPLLVDAVPGDPGYSPIHSLNRLVVSDTYSGELITSSEALADALELGLVEEPVPTGSFVTSPIVVQEILLEVGAGTQPASPQLAYAHGRTVGMFRFGGEVAAQPITAFAPTSQLSILREAQKASHDLTRPIFQATIPLAPPTTKVANYVALGVIVKVDLAPGTSAVSITHDNQLFTRSATGAITGTTAQVARFEVTSDTVLWPLQVADGAP
jgi:hypothetical protein